LLKNDAAPPAFGDAVHSKKAVAVKEGHVVALREAADDA
jgi:hypothetical protein